MDDEELIRKVDFQLADLSSGGKLTPEQSDRFYERAKRWAEMEQNGQPFEAIPVEGDNYCPRCKERGQTWPGDAPKCAFPDSGEFNADNWNCATMNELRHWAYELDPDGGSGLGYYCRVEDSSLGVVCASGEYVVMGWYKDRGKTGSAMLFYSDRPPRPLMLEDAERCIAWHEARRQRSE